MDVGIRPIALDDEGISEACEQTFDLWHQGLDRARYEQRLRDSFARLPQEMRYVGVRDRTGALAASARLLSLRLCVGGQPSDATGIAAVFVRPDLRGLGWGSGLIAGILAESEQMGAGCALLFSDIGRRYYERMGFAAAPALDWTAGVSDVPHRHELSLRQAAPADIAQMIQVFNKRAERSVLSPVRTTSWWRHYRWWRRAAPDLVLCDSGGDVGYATVRPDGETLRVFEWVAPGVEPDRVWATLRAEAIRRGCERLGGWLQPDRRQPWMSVVERAEGIPMVARTDGRAVQIPDGAVFEELDHF